MREPITNRMVVELLENIRLINKSEGGEYFSRDEVVTALDLLYRDQELTFKVREAFDMQHQLERIATALERIADSYVEGVVLSTDPEHYTGAQLPPAIVIKHNPYPNDQSE